MREVFLYHLERLVGRGSYRMLHGVKSVQAINSRRFLDLDGPVCAFPGTSPLSSQENKNTTCGAIVGASNKTYARN